MSNFEIFKVANFSKRLRPFRAYELWNVVNRNVEHGSEARRYPSFNSRAKQIETPPDVESCVVPEIEHGSDLWYWAGELVYQIKFRAENDRSSVLCK